MIYLNEGFDGVTAPALPSGGSTVGSPVTSTSHFYSSPNSLKMAGTGARQEYWEASATDSNYGQVSASAKFYWDATPTANMTLHLYLRATNGPTSSVVPNYCLAAFLGIYSGSSGMVLDYYNSTGTTPTSAASIAQSVFNGVSTWSSGTWYNVTFTAAPWADCTADKLVLYVQRMSDGSAA